MNNKMDRFTKIITTTVTLMAGMLVLYRLVVFIRSIMTLRVEAKKLTVDIDQDKGIMRSIVGMIGQPSGNPKPQHGNNHRRGSN